MCWSCLSGLWLEGQCSWKESTWFHNYPILYYIVWGTLHLSTWQLILKYLSQVDYNFRIFANRLYQLWFEIHHAGNVYTTKIGRCYKIKPFFFFQECWLVYQYPTADLCMIPIEPHSVWALALCLLNCAFGFKVELQNQRDSTVG